MSVTSAIGLGSHTATPRRIEPLYVSIIRVVLYAFAISLYLYPLSSYSGIGAAIAMATIGGFLGTAAARRRLRLPVALVFLPLALMSALLLADQVLDTGWIGALLGIEGSFAVADGLSFGLAGFFLAIVLRYLAARFRTLSVLEVLFVAGSVAVTLADHRNRMLNRPRFLSDWAWSFGVDPSHVLIVVGAVATVLAVLLFLRDQPVLKVVTSLLLLFLLGFVYTVFEDRRIEQKSASDSLGLSGKNKRGGGKGGKGQSKNDELFKNNYDQPNTPQPVAIAILRDDYQPENGVMYFRQRALSKYNGLTLAADPRDKDVITSLKEGSLNQAQHHQNPDHHFKLPTTMYLLVDHPQPPALTNATTIKLIENPNPQQFVSAYEVKSLVLSVAPKRLLGRDSAGADWSVEKKQHYTRFPDDPRYRALSDIIVRKLDPRFAADDLAKAYAIKRFLEKRGFYTRKSKHASQKDPTASFLFGSMRGYCVHFAHAAVYLFRSQGIAARVALGYAVQTHRRSGGSSILIMGDRAHAWPEIHLDGVGWLTFDIYPERTDMPPAKPIDYDLEKLLGELARKDPTGGRSPDATPLTIPWALIGQILLLLLGTLVLLGYLIKGYRRLAPVLAGDGRFCRAVYIAALDRLSEVGVQRRRGETRERHARRVTALAPSMSALTNAHLARALGSSSVGSNAEFRELATQVKRELGKNAPILRRILGWIDPWSWLRTR
jgi:hypothetical protein